MFYIRTCASAVGGGGINFAQIMILANWAHFRLTFASCVTMDIFNDPGTL